MKDIRVAYAYKASGGTLSAKWMYNKAFRAGAPPLTRSKKPVSQIMRISKISGSKAIAACQRFGPMHQGACTRSGNVLTMAEYDAAPHIMNTLMAMILRGPISAAR